MKKAIILVIVILVALIGASYWSKSLQSKDQDVISTRGIHYHPTLEIFVNGEAVEIPQNVGLTGTHSPIHTHEDLPIVHLEFDGLVRRDDVKLKNFFTVWGRDINSFGENVSMTVNGETSELFGEYEMRDGDKIELRYE